MKSDVKFYEVYELPAISKLTSLAARKKLLEFIEVPEEYIESSEEASVRIMINTPVMRSHNQRKLGKMTGLKCTRNALKHTAAKRPLIIAKQKEKAAENSPELEWLTISEKKLQRNAKAVGPQNQRNIPSAIKLNPLFLLCEKRQNLQRKLQHNRETKIEADKKRKRHEAVKFLASIAKKRRDVMRGANWQSSTDQDKSLQKDAKRGLNDRSVSLTETGLNPHAVSRKKTRRHTVATTEKVSEFIGALRELALAPIKSTV
eukprot:TRINITY_DN14327_c0_g1_i3.p1 TRINITY_DN14327_c0_g1~~TRINITY_DN14327_c0_g1_i3.p1  ORF type:complete len:260 (-),score=36.06 TRINITY_DN14327_c0_g1_i3:175-954(-)